MHTKNGPKMCDGLSLPKGECKIYDRLMDNYCRDEYCNFGYRNVSTKDGGYVCQPPQKVYCAREYFDAVSCLHSLQSFTEINGSKLLFLSTDKQRSLAHLTQGIITDISINIEVDGSADEKFSITEFSTATHLLNARIHMLVLGFGDVYGFCEYTSELRVSDTKFMLEADVKRHVCGLVGGGDKVYVMKSYISVRVAKIPPEKCYTFNCNKSAKVVWFTTEIWSSFNSFKYAKTTDPLTTSPESDS